MKFIQLSQLDIFWKKRKTMIAMIEKLHCFINVEDRPSISIKLPYSPTSVNKNKVACNENTDTISSFGEVVSIMSTIVYFVQQTKVREWPKGILLITTTPSMWIKPLKESIGKSKSSLKELISDSVQFPSTSVKIASSIKCCPQCGKSPAIMKGKLFTCEHCKEMTLADETETRYTLKLDQKSISICGGDNSFSTVN